MESGVPSLDSPAWDRPRVRSARIVLDRLEVLADVGFHDYEIGNPQRLLITVEIWLENLHPPSDDDPDQAWDYDFLKAEVTKLAGSRRYNLQETLAHAVFERVAALHGVKDIRVATAKPDIYPDARGVGVEIASFSGNAPSD